MPWVQTFIAYLYPVPYTPIRGSWTRSRDSFRFRHVLAMLAYSSMVKHIASPSKPLHRSGPETPQPCRHIQHSRSVGSKAKQNLTIQICSRRAWQEYWCVVCRIQRCRLRILSRKSDQLGNIDIPPGGKWRSNNTKHSGNANFFYYFFYRSIVLYISWQDTIQHAAQVLYTTLGIVCFSESDILRKPSCFAQVTWPSLSNISKLFLCIWTIYVLVFVTVHTNPSSVK